MPNRPRSDPSVRPDVTPSAAGWATALPIATWVRSSEGTEPAVSDVVLSLSGEVAHCFGWSFYEGRIDHPTRAPAKA